MNIAPPLFLIVLLSVCLSACGSEEPETVPDPEIGIEDMAHPFTLSGTTWELEQINGREPQSAKNGRGKPNIRFNQEEGTVSGFAGCNTFHGRYETQEAGSISFSRMAATKMMCEHMETEEAVMTMLQEADTFAVENSRLFLKSGEEILATFKPDDNER